MTMVKILQAIEQEEPGSERARRALVTARVTVSALAGIEMVGPLGRIVHRRLPVVSYFPLPLGRGCG